MLAIVYVVEFMSHIKIRYLPHGSLISLWSLNDNVSLTAVRTPLFFESAIAMKKYGKFLLEHLGCAVSQKCVSCAQKISLLYWRASFHIYFLLAGWLRPLVLIDINVTPMWMK